MTIKFNDNSVKSPTKKSAAHQPQGTSIRKRLRALSTQLFGELLNVPVETLVPSRKSKTKKV